MTVEFKESNVVVLAPAHPQFNPMAVTQAWMIGHLQVQPNDFAQQGTIQLPILFNAPTKQFHLLVLQERVQVTPSAPWEEGWGAEGDTVRRVMGGVLRQFGDVPYVAAGLNFWWTVHIDERPNSDTSRRLFFAGGNPFFREFDVPDACFGAYASKNFLGARLKVDVKPINEQGNDTDATRVLFGFNFNLLLAGDDRLAQIEELLGQWDNARAEGSRIVQQVHDECGL